MGASRLRRWVAHPIFHLSGMGMGTGMGMRACNGATEHPRRHSVKLFGSKAAGWGGFRCGNGS